jgi:hypothetical protein
MAEAVVKLNVQVGPGPGTPLPVKAVGKKKSADDVEKSADDVARAGNVEKSADDVMNSTIGKYFDTFEPHLIVQFRV